MKANLIGTGALLSLALAMILPGCGDRPRPVGLSSNHGSSNDDKQVCAKQLQAVYQAIQAYRRDNKDLPEWLSDLVPQYLPSTNALVCPHIAKLGNPHPYNELGDPRVPLGYIYDFSPALWSGHPMREFKRRQMGLIGGAIPLVRCLYHQPALSVSFDGAFYEGPTTWESTWATVLDPRELSAERLFRRDAQSQMPPGGEPEETAHREGRGN